MVKHGRSPIVLALVNVIVVVNLSHYLNETISY